ncbi:dethiobiotin synthase [Candidatus Saganbacteria bacterium CG08_land_8_20_14_0_20_45_16]|uniref:ATP-dependent dethiobiotin synthetase BioD n=1 Tax=Candidatus Saganbacteria bacterium CG08_land_8_20_14_0_20_45_16 TaxID=2014293 RepID=A0A2H0XWP3_UNCSA|nr:MAG: dethiobiotin synthase [Candidatus Saganbacteria bacterium CG08_land_8_20_14_0_20_45_16]
MPGIFITATDTEVGKTLIAAGLVNFFRNQGINAGYMKPISCGKDNDAVFVKQLLKLKDPLSLINPISLPYPLSSLAAARKAKRKIELKKIVKAFTILNKKYELVIVEGVGGAQVPITEEFMVADLIKLLDIPTIIVARAGLGTIIHTLLTVKALQKRRIKIQGIIMNGYRGKGLSEESNAEIIFELTKIPILAKVPWLT